MKSFADWTDEIRALMNPPAPMADTCNLRSSWLTPRFMEGMKGQIMDPEEFRKELLGEFKIEGVQWTKDELAKLDEASGTAIAFRSGRQTGKTVMQNEWHKRAVEFLATQDYSKLEERIIKDGSALWGFNPTGEPTIVIHDEIYSDESPVYVMGPQLKIVEHWARDNGVLPSQLRHVRTREDLYGLPRGIKILSVGNWMSNKRGAQIDEMQEIMAAREIEVVYV